MSIPEIITLVIFIPYLGLMLLLALGWSRIKKKPLPAASQGGDTRLSVIVPFRNEEDHIDRLFDHLNRQDYDAENWEIIAINDHSEDTTPEKLASWVNRTIAPLHILDNQANESGKKAALEKGISHARGELIITTDADCLMGEKWLSSIVRCYESHKPSMILSPVLYDSQPESLFGSFQALENFSLLAATAGSSGIGKPLFGSAANMAFQKQTYQKLSDPFTAQAASGDDTLLLLKIKALNPDKIMYNRSGEAVITTKPADRISQFWNQRKRWVSKSKYYTDGDIILAGLVVVITNTWMMALVAGAFFSLAFLKVWVTAFIAKSLIDLVLLFPVVHYFRRHDLWSFYLPSQLLYPLYSSLSAIAGRISGFQWKNRYYHVN